MKTYLILIQLQKIRTFASKKYIFAIELRISKRYIDMKKEKNLESLSDDEILQGFKDAEHDGFENML